VAEEKLKRWDFIYNLRVKRFTCLSYLDKFQKPYLLTADRNFEIQIHKTGNNADDVGQVSLLTMQFLVQVPSRRDRQGSDELFKLYGAILWTRMEQVSLQELLPSQEIYNYVLSMKFGALLNYRVCVTFPILHV
jgi:hypothetical protein